MAKTAPHSRLALPHSSKPDLCDLPKAEAPQSAKADKSNPPKPDASQDFAAATEGHSKGASQTLPPINNLAHRHLKGARAFFSSSAGALQVTKVNCILPATVTLG